jgi:hypothetical protein
VAKEAANALSKKVKFSFYPNLFFGSQPFHTLAFCHEPAHKCGGRAFKIRKMNIENF